MMAHVTSPPEDGFLRALRARLPVSAHAHRAALDELAVARKEIRVLERSVASEGKLQKVDDDRFRAVRDEVKRHDRTKLDRNRLWVLWEAVRNTAALGGAAAEVGTYRGGSAWFIAAAFTELTGRAPPMDVIDTFEGHPQSQVGERDSHLYTNEDMFRDTSYADVVEYLAPFPQVTVHAGEFSAVAPRLSERSYRVVHLDVDLYEPTLDCLGFFGPRLVPAGVVVIDDYDKPSCPGIRQAAEEFLDGSAGFQSWNPRTKQLVLVKR